MSKAPDPFSQPLLGLGILSTTCPCGSVNLDMRRCRLDDNVNDYLREADVT